MKKNSSNKRSILRCVMWLLLTATVLSACNNRDQGHEHDTYTCPMHPTVISDRPGTCPVCGMDLVRKARPGEEVEITEDLSKLIKSPNEVVVASIKTVKGEYKSLSVPLEAQGMVTYDTRSIYTIPARAGGRVEKVWLKFMFQKVATGQKVAEIYSPELLTAQRELVFLVENDAANITLVDGARKKLELLGMTRSEVSALERKKQVTNTVSIFSPYSGYVIGDLPAPALSVASTTPGMSDGMGGGNEASSAAVMPQQQSSEILREGTYVAKGQTLFRIVNPAALRIELDLPAAQAGAIGVGDSIHMDFGNNQEEPAAVDFVQPFFTEGQDFLKIRVITRKDDLHIGHLVNATIFPKAVEGLWVPKAAVVDLGVQKIVFVKEKGVFKPKKVITGVRAENMIEVKSGLASSEEIAENAQFLIDSESFVKPLK
ncbi:MAG TPA: efflux RND transporter periplasmic adaptor subunit [Chryseosolibacter sp.]|nr:efflux RND transporter periplasmic adaptor subunit [Chryseosolibacter sp.]